MVEGEEGRREKEGLEVVQRKGPQRVGQRRREGGEAGLTMQKRARIICSKSMSLDLMSVEPYQNKNASVEEEEKEERGVSGGVNEGEKGGKATQKKRHTHMWRR